MSHPAPSLKVLAEDKETPGVSKATTFRVDPELIFFEEGFNLRTDNDETALHTERLYLAMKAGAFIPPIDVNVSEGKIIARTGHCRTRAAVRLKKEISEYTLECRQFRGNDAEAVLHMIGSDTGSKPLTPLEQGIGFLRLIRFGMQPNQIATKLGLSRVTIDNGLQLAEASPEIQQMISNGEVSATTAREAIRQGTDGVEALKAAVVEERKTPTKKKNGKKKKVTAKKLRGTAAAKKPGTRKNAKREPEPPAADTGETVQQVTIIVGRDLAAATMDFLKAFAFDNALMLEMASIIETALL